MTPTDDQLAEELSARGLSKREIARQLGVDDKSIPLAIERARQRRSRGLDPREEFIRCLVRHEEVIKSLKGRDRELVKRRFLDRHPVTLDVLAEEWDLSRQRVWQLEQDLLARLEPLVMEPGKKPEKKKP